MSDWEEAKRAAQSLFHDELRSGEPEEKYQPLIQEARFELGERHPFLAYPLTGLGNLVVAHLGRMAFVGDLTRSCVLACNIILY